MSKAGKTKVVASTSKRTTPKTAAKKPVPKTGTKKVTSARTALTPSKVVSTADAKSAFKGAKPLSKAKIGKVAGAHAGKKEKTIRDSFNMPAADYALIGQMKARSLASSREVKKSELLRAGLRMLAALNDEAFKSALASVPSVKTGRPGKKQKG